MPQATSELRTEWGIDPSNALRHIESNFIIDQGIISPRPNYLPTEMDLSAIAFLLMEWDYGYKGEC